VIAAATPRDAAMAAGRPRDRVASRPRARSSSDRSLAEVTVREAPPPRLSRLMEVARREERARHRAARAELAAARTRTRPRGFDICRDVPAGARGRRRLLSTTFQLPDGRFGVAVGDVSGKGVPAAFCMTLTKGFMEVAATESARPTRALARELATCART
jgi:hypothetical protein